MSKEYFSHDYGTRNKIKLAALLHKEKSRGYGLFWIIVEMLHEDTEKWLELEEFTYIAIEKESGEEADFIKEFIERCINVYKVFFSEGKRFTTERVLRNIEKRNELSEKKSAAGKKSAEVRRSQQVLIEHNPTGVEHVLNIIEHNSTKESKLKESKVNETKVNFNRANALVVAGANDDKNLKEEYRSLVEKLSGTEIIEVYNSISNFIISNKPSFIDPYVDIWNLAANKYGLVKVENITDERKDKIRTRAREPGFDFIKIIQCIRKEPFYRGENSSGWKVSFNYVIKNQKNYTEMIEKLSA